MYQFSKREICLPFLLLLLPLLLLLAATPIYAESSSTISNSSTRSMSNHIFAGYRLTHFKSSSPEKNNNLIGAKSKHQGNLMGPSIGYIYYGENLFYRMSGFFTSGQSDVTLSNHQRSAFEGEKLGEGRLDSQRFRSDLSLGKVMKSRNPKLTLIPYFYFGMESISESSDSVDLKVNSSYDQSTTEKHKLSFSRSSLQIGPSMLFDYALSEKMNLWVDSSLLYLFYKKATSSFDEIGRVDHEKPQLHFKITPSLRYKISSNGDIYLSPSWEYYKSKEGEFASAKTINYLNAEAGLIYHF